MSDIAAAFRMAGLELLARRRRILALLATAALFLAAGATAATLGRTHGHVEIDTLYRLGGYPLVSGLLLAGWLIGRFPLLAVLVLTAGVASDDGGHARLLATRPASPRLLYGARLITLWGLAFAISATLLPAFDLIVLGEWAGRATLVLIVAHLLVWGSLTALLSTFTRLDAWIALLIALLAMIWSALVDAGFSPLAPILTEILAFLLPPVDRILQLEAAFAGVEPIPWSAFAFCAGYGLVLLLLAGWRLGRREI